MNGKIGGGGGRRRSFRPGVERVERRRLLATFVVTQAGDAGPGSLRQAILDANARPGADNIEFAIPASTAPGLDVPVSGFDPLTQTWRIELLSPLPALTDPVTIDGFSQAEAPVPFRYPGDTDEPTLIRSVPNSTTARDGFNAQIRVIVDGGAIGRAAFPAPTGFVLNTVNSNLRGLVIDGFAVGVEVPLPGNAGNRIQGNSIGAHLLYRVDLETGEPLPDPSNVAVAGVGNSADGIIVAGTNTTVGGFNAQEANTITLSGARGVWLRPGGEGSQVLGNQIGVLGPSAGGFYFQLGNGAEGVLIESSADGLASSHVIGGPVAGSGNVISANGGHGVRIAGAGALRNRVEGNFIGAAPGGGYPFGAGDPGNGGDGVFLQGAPSNRVGGPSDSRRNVIAANAGAGVRIAGASASGNIVAGNFIGLTAGGDAALGNKLDGVRIESAATANAIGDGNVISANLRGVTIAGPTTTGNAVADNFIGTDATGRGDLGNAREGVRIEGSPGNRVSGNAQGSQVISGNDVGVAIVGPSASGNVLVGNFIGTDVDGLLEVHNSRQGVLILDAPGNAVGGPSAETRNLISGNHWGVELAGPGSTGNVVAGNFIGTDVSGVSPLSSEVDGVLIRLGASSNIIGGATSEAGNVIAFNRRDGVRVEDASIGNAILTNRIFDNDGLGIRLVAPVGPGPGPNLLRPAPTIERVRSSTGFSNVQGALQSVPSTTFTVQFFANPTLDPTGFGEGRRFLGQAVVTTDAGGLAPFSNDVPGAVAPGESVTATATDTSGNTSEFSLGVAEQLGTIQFAMTSFVVDEAAGEAIITVTRVGGSGGQATVMYATAGGSATPGVDYVPVSGTLTFGLGVDVQTFRVPIIDDDQAEAIETVVLVLSAPAGAATLGTPATAVLNIVDDDQPGNVAFAMASFEISEDSGVATITVVRDAAGGTVTVAYATAGGSALPGVDYVPVSGVLTFGPGQTVQTFTVPVLFNPRSASNPVVGLVLGEPTGGASLGSPAAATLTIADVGAPRAALRSAVADRRGILRITLGFDRAMIGGRVEDLRNYGYSLQIPGHNRRLGTRQDVLVPLASAVYDPVARTVTLTTLQPIRPGTPVLVLINQVTGVPGAGVGVADDRGVLLDGDGDGFPGGTFSAVLRAPRASDPPRQSPIAAPPSGLRAAWAARFEARAARLAGVAGLDRS